MLSKMKLCLSSYVKRILCLLLILLLLLAAPLPVIAQEIDISDSSAISYWAIAGSFNSWNTKSTTTRISGSSGSVVIDMNSYINKTIEFKAVAYENNEDCWNGKSGSQTEINPFTDYVLEWKAGENIKFKVTKRYVVFYISQNSSNQNVIRVTQRANKDYPEGGTGYEKTASLGSSIKGNDNLLTTKATFYDYYTDNEVMGSWLTSLDGSYRTTANREPFTFFNWGVATYASKNSTWTHPLYFGDFNTDSGYQQDGYTGAGASNLERYFARPNNSTATTAGTGSFNCAVVGLVDKELSSTQELTMNNVNSPYFNKDFIVGNGYGSIVNTEFPFRKYTSNGVNYYEFDSSNAKDNIWFDGLNSTSPTINYGAGTDYAVYDAMSGYGGTDNAPGFFPFDKHADHDHNAYDFGFGMKLEVPFTLGAGGKTKGEDTKFSFTGDDDLWVYLDGKLVLDMGGDHKMASGAINFATKTSSVESQDTTYASDRNGSFDWFNNNDVTANHTLTIFYMERGMIESNLKINFNFQPTTDQLSIQKTIDVEDVNAGLIDDVKNVDDYEFQIMYGTTQSSVTTIASNKTYIHNDVSEQTDTEKQTTSEGKITLGGSDNALFKDQFTLKNYIKVSEDDPNTGNVFTYDTSWKLSDKLYSRDITNGTGLTTTFKYMNVENNDQVSTYLNLEYINKPHVNSLTIKKEIRDASSAIVSDSTTEFPVTLLIDLSGNGEYKPYALEYTEVGISKTMSEDGTFLIKQGSDIVINNIPIGAKYKIVETPIEGYIIPDAIEGEVLSTSNEETITNIKDSAKVDISIYKTVDGATPTINEFTFDLSSITKTPTGFSNKTIIQSNVHNNGKNVVFNTIPVDGSGTYYYTIKEKDLGDNKYLYDTNEYYVRADVEFYTSFQKYVTEIKYYKNETDAINDTNSLSSLTIDNKKIGSIKVLKQNDKGSLLADCVFAIYSNINDAKAANTNYAKDISENTIQPVTTVASADGVKFANLRPGTYYLVELRAPDTYSIYGGVIEITIPTPYNAGDIVNNVTATSSGYLYDVTVTVKDNAIVSPQTAGQGIKMYIIFGLGLIYLSIAIYIYTKRNKTKKYNRRF